MIRKLVIEGTEEQIEKLRDLLKIDHEHYEGQNECEICDTPLIKALIDDLSDFKKMRETDTSLQEAFDKVTIKQHLEEAIKLIKI